MVKLRQHVTTLDLMAGVKVSLREPGPTFG
jgi:hypothetical protein